MPQKSTPSSQAVQIALRELADDYPHLQDDARWNLIKQATAEKAAAPTSIETQEIDSMAVVHTVPRERLQTKEIAYRQVVETANSIIFQMDNSGNVTYFNEFAQLFFGYTEDEIIGQNVIGTIVPEVDIEGRATGELLRKILKNPEQYSNNENQNIRKDGRPVWVAWTNKGLYDDQGNLTEILCIGNDITERKIREESLRRAEQNFRGIFENAVEGIFQTTTDGRYLSANPALARIYGYESPEALIQQLSNISGQLYVDPYRRDEFKQLIEENEYVSDFESEVFRKDGSKIWISEHARVVRDLVTDKVLYYEGTVTDITKRKRAEEGLLKALEKTESLYQIIDAMVTSTEPEATFEVVLDMYLRMLRLNEGAVSLVDETTGKDKVVVVFAKGKRLPTSIDTIDTTINPKISRRMAEIKAPIAFSSVANHPDDDEGHNYLLELLQAKAVLYLPIVLRGQIIGTLMATSPQQRHIFSQGDVEVGQLVADQLAIWLESRRLLQEAQYRSSRLQTAAEVSRYASSMLDADELINTSVNFIRDQFDFYYVGMFLVDEANEWAVLRAGTGDAGKRQLAKNHRLKIGGDSMIGWSVQNRKARIALDVGEEAVHFQNPDLPDTRSEMALPLISREQVIGALTVQSTEQGAFSDEDITLLQTMADQLANAIANARLFESVAQAQAQSEGRLQEIQALQRLSAQLSGTLNLDEILNIFFDACTEEIGFEYAIFSMVDEERQRVRAIGGFGVPESNLERANHALDSKDIMVDIIKTGKTELITGWDDRFDKATFEAEGHADWIRIFAPITLRQNNVGLIEAGFNKNTGKTISDSQLRQLQAFINQTALALDNAKRYEASLRQAKRAALIKEITTKVRASTNIDTILQTTVEEIGKAMNSKSYIHLDSLQSLNDGRE